MTDSCVLPDFNLAQAAEFARQLYALDGSLKQLDGERDLNFLITGEQGRFVFKIANLDESPAMLECQQQVFQLLADEQVFPRVATVLESVNRNLIETVVDANGVRHVCRVLPFIEGRMMMQLDSLSPALLDDLGRSLAALDRALESFSHPALERPLLWKMDDALSILEAFKPLLGNQQSALIEYYESEFRQHTQPLLGELRRAVIHNDANQANVLVDETESQIVSIIDFGDMVTSWLVVEPAIAATYTMLERADPITNAQQVLRGYHAGLPLNKSEISVIYDLICMRLCMSVCICAHQRQLEPDNEYLSLDVAAVWKLLDELSKLDPQKVRESMLDVCDTD